MIIEDKISEFIYQQASHYFTKWRIFCFIITCLIVSDAIFPAFTTNFWLSSLSDAGKQTWDAILKLPLFTVLLIAFFSFIGAPLVSKRLSMFILQLEIPRAQEYIERINSHIGNEDTSTLIESLARRRDTAINGERRIQLLKGINETLIYATMLSAAMYTYKKASLLCLPLVVIVPILIFFSIQEILSTYLKTIYSYKKATEYISKNNNPT